MWLCVHFGPGGTSSSKPPPGCPSYSRLPMVPYRLCYHCNPLWFCLLWTDSPIQHISQPWRSFPDSTAGLHYVSMWCFSFPLLSHRTCLLCGAAIEEPDSCSCFPEIPVQAVSPQHSLTRSSQIGLTVWRMSLWILTSYFRTLQCHNILFWDLIY